jgi:hypothetical protein
LELALRCDPPDLCLLSSLDYKNKPSAPGSIFSFLNIYIDFNFQFL